MSVLRKAISLAGLPLRLSLPLFSHRSILFSFCKGVAPSVFVVYHVILIFFFLWNPLFFTLTNVSVDFIFSALFLHLLFLFSFSAVDLHCTKRGRNGAAVLLCLPQHCKHTYTAVPSFHTPVSCFCCTSHFGCLTGHCHPYSTDLSLRCIMAPTQPVLFCTHASAMPNACKAHYPLQRSRIARRHTCCRCSVS